MANPEITLWYVHSYYSSYPVISPRVICWDPAVSEAHFSGR